MPKRLGEYIHTCFNLSTMVTFFCPQGGRCSGVQLSLQFNLLHVIVLSQNYDVCLLLLASCTTSSPELFPSPKMEEAILYGEKPLLSVQILWRVQRKVNRKIQQVGGGREKELPLFFLPSSFSAILHHLNAWNKLQ